jgi:hypothetical protein
MIRCDDAAGAGHIFHNEGRITGNMFAHVPRNGPRIRIESASRGKSNDNADCLTFKGGLRRVENTTEKVQRNYSNNHAEDFSIHSNSLDVIA